MEQPKERLTLQQHQQAIDEAIWIDASPLEWPTVDKMWLLCSALIDSVQMVDYLRSRLAAVEAERDAARAGEARAVELCVKASKVIRWCLESITRIDPIGGMEGFPDEFGGVGYDCEVIGESSSALDWLDQQRREAVAAWIEKEATKCRKQNNEYYDRGVDCMLREAAALRAGEVPND